MPNTLLFVYGTLKQGYCRAAALDGQRLLGDAATEPAYRMVNVGEYPGLIADAAGCSIAGELWEVDAECLARPDEIEGVAEQLYQRRTVCLLPPHDTARVEGYFYLRDTAGMPDCGPRWM
jgi:gamma-glutamylcyclotransferase (GGCT)/AIG2-like uncharacterized protein YtfP